MGIGSTLGQGTRTAADTARPGAERRASCTRRCAAPSTGAGPLPPAAQAADKQLAEQGGDVDRAVHEVIENHVRLAGAQGFATNIGGLVTAAVTIPANIAGLALIQCRLVAGHRAPARLRPRPTSGSATRSWPACSARTR